MTNCTIQPVGQRALLKEIQPRREDNGILLPDDAEDEDQVKLVKVLAVGTPLEHVNIKKGDRVLLPSYAASMKKVEFDGEEYWIAKLEDILGIVKP